jgi:hypothetical protein
MQASHDPASSSRSPRGRLAPLGVIAVALALLAPAGALLAQPSAAPRVTTTPPRDTRALPPEDFRYSGHVGRTLDDSDPPQFPQPVSPPRARRTSS